MTNSYIHFKQIFSLLNLHWLILQHEALCKSTDVLGQFYLETPRYACYCISASLAVASCLAGIDELRNHCTPLSPSSHCDGSGSSSQSKWSTFIRLFTLSLTQEGRAFRCFHYSDFVSVISEYANDSSALSVIVRSD